MEIAEKFCFCLVFSAIFHAVRVYRLRWRRREDMRKLSAAGVLCAAAAALVLARSMYELEHIRFADDPA